MPGLDIARLTRYPPEIFLYADNVDLQAGTNIMLSYLRLEATGWVVSLYGASFTPLQGGSFTVNADGVSNVARIDDLGGVKGLGYEEEFKVAAFTSMIASIYSPTDVSDYAWRYKLRVDKPTPILKILFGKILTERERSIADEFGLDTTVATGMVEQFDPYRGLERILTVAKTMSNPGMFARIAVPSGYKLVLLDIAADKPTAPDRLTLRITRDYTCVFDPIDAYCLPGVETPTWFNARYHSSLRIVCLDELLIEADRLSGGPYRVRAVYGIGRLTIPEKIRWGVPLTDWEKEIAEKENLYNMVEAGLI